MSRRGHVLLLVVLLMSVMLAGAALVRQRATSGYAAYAADDIRLTALWLGRSALDNGIGGTQRVQTAAGLAVVQRTSTGITVDLAGHRAEIEAAPYRERYR